MDKIKSRKGKLFVRGMMDGLSVTTRIIPTPQAEITIKRQAKTDLATDWVLIGDDLRNGLRKYEKEVKHITAKANRKVTRRARHGEAA